MALFLELPGLLCPYVESLKQGEHPSMPFSVATWKAKAGSSAANAPKCRTDQAETTLIESEAKYKEGVGVEVGSRVVADQSGFKCTLCMRFTD